MLSNTLNFNGKQSANDCEFFEGALEDAYNIASSHDPYADTFVGLAVDIISRYHANLEHGDLDDDERVAALQAVAEGVLILTALVLGSQGVDEEWTMRVLDFTAESYRVFYEFGGK